MYLVTLGSQSGDDEPYLVGYDAVSFRSDSTEVSEKQHVENMENTNLYS
jgi:hypothetical protein